MDWIRPLFLRNPPPPAPLTQQRDEGDWNREGGRIVYNMNPYRIGLFVSLIFEIQINTIEKNYPDAFHRSYDLALYQEEVAKKCKGRGSFFLMENSNFLTF